MEKYSIERVKAKDNGIITEDKLFIYENMGPRTSLFQMAIDIEDVAGFIKLLSLKSFKSKIKSEEKRMNKVVKKKAVK